MRGGDEPIATTQAAAAKKSRSTPVVTAKAVSPKTTEEEASIETEEPIK